jgi:predicted ABC-type ATPase
VTVSPEARPVVVALAGPNGAGKTTFFHAHLAEAGLRFVNTDALAAELEIDAMSAAAVADAVRRELVRQRESFVFETVFSDPVGDKLSFLEEAVATGYEVVLCFIGVSGPEVCEQRVSMRVSQGGHDVPDDRLVARYPRTMANLRAALDRLPVVLVYDNDDLSMPFRKVAEFRDGQRVTLMDPPPSWLAPLVRE